MGSRAGTQGLTQRVRSWWARRGCRPGPLTRRTGHAASPSPREGTRPTDCPTAVSRFSARRGLARRERIHPLEHPQSPHGCRRPPDSWAEVERSDFIVHGPSNCRPRIQAGPAAMPCGAQNIPGPRHFQRVIRRARYSNVGRHRLGNGGRFRANVAWSLTRGDGGSAGSRMFPLGLRASATEPSQAPSTATLATLRGEVRKTVSALSGAMGVAGRRFIPTGGPGLTSLASDPVAAWPPLGRRWARKPARGAGDGGRP